MGVASENILNRQCDPPAAMLRAGCVALFLCLSGCGGGTDGGAPPSSSAPTTELEPAPGTPPPSLAPATLLVGTALSIDDGASGNPVNLRVVRSANGDGFAVWQADDGARRNLWANRYHAATAAWGGAVNIEASDVDIGKFDLTVDAGGNATVVWTEPPPGGGSAMVMSARFEAGAGAWGAAVLLKNEQGDPTPRVTSDATGSVLAMYGGGRFFDPASGAWRPEEQIPMGIISSGDISGPVALLDGSGNALVVEHYAHFFDSLASNYFSRSTGSWDQFPPGFEDGILRPVPNSFVFGFINKLQLATTPGGNYLAAWEVTFDTVPETFEIRVARFTSSTRTWTAAQTLVPINAQNDVRFHRLGSDGNGNALLLWTESDGMRTALKAMRLDQAGLACDAVRVIDRAVGGGAGRADLGVDPQGNAIAIWQQFEGGRPDDGSRSNIAVNRFDRATGAWAKAVLVETEPGNAISPGASASGGRALLGWIQSEGGVNRVKALLQPLADAPSQ
jgi:hypothetical protein